MRNAEIALHFDELADLYELDGAIVHRVLAYRNAAKSIRDSTASVEELTKERRVTELHDVVLDFGHTVEGDSLFLFLTGWIYPTDASINLSLAQSHSMPIVPPQLQVKDRAGAWQTVIPDIGFPAGKNKTVIVDLTGKFLSADHRIRIRTTMEIYWDRAFIATTAAARPPSLPALTTTTRLGSAGENRCWLVPWWRPPMPQPCSSLFTRAACGCARASAPPSKSSPAPTIRLRFFSR